VRPSAAVMQGDHVYADKQLVIARTALPDVLSIMGAIDYFNAANMARALEAELESATDRGDMGDPTPTTAEGRLHIDLSGLEFVDTCGIRALIEVTKSGGGRRVLVIHGLAPLFRRVIEVVGWGELPGLVIEEGLVPGSSE
jgi:ABC-type transporter Mla MlaB component